MQPHIARHLCRSIIAAMCAAAASTSAGAESAPPPPRLAVIVSIDQGREDYLERFRPYFVANGFRRLLEHGAHYTACHYGHADTKTAIGHATISTGAHPSTHGIIGNDWLEGESFTEVNCVEDDAAAEIGGTSGKPCSPRRLLATTIGEQLKQHYGDAARVCAVANKDRSAILLAGHRADGVYWLGDNDRFVSSTFYFPDGRLPAWVDAHNAAHPLSAWFNQPWERVLDAGAYERTQGADDAAGEFSGHGLDRAFPHVINGGSGKIGPRFYDDFDRSPFALNIITDFARALVEAEKLGADDVPDLLCIGFSQIDAIGHEYGPDSHELMDSILRLDRLLAEFLTFLDGRVGGDRYVVVVTADHGVAPMPERLALTHPEIKAARVDLRDLDRSISAALTKAFGPDPESRLWFRRDNSGYRVNPAALAATGAPREQAVAVVKEALLAYPLVAAAFTAEELAQAPEEGQSLASMFRRTHHAGRGQDVFFALLPYHNERRPTGATHGSPYEYDTHVPMLWFGRGVTAGVHDERVSVTDLAPTLSGLLGIPAPPQASGRRLF